MPALVKIPEAKIEKKIVAFCRKNRLYCRKFSSPSNRGVPDRIIGRDGHVLFLELKSKDNTPTSLQTHEIKEIMSYGLHATWVDNYNDAVDLLVRTFKLTQIDKKATPVNAEDLI